MAVNIFVSLRIPRRTIVIDYGIPWSYSLNPECANRNKSRLLSRLLKCLSSLYGKQCGPRSDCSYRSSLFWVHAVCFYT